MTLKRGYLIIASDILRATEGGAGITRIVYGCNLNFNIVKTHLADLVGRGLLNVEVAPSRADRTAYRWTTTDRGRELVHRMNTVLSLWDVSQAPEVVSL